MMECAPGGLRVALCFVLSTIDWLLISSSKSRQDAAGQLRAIEDKPWNGSFDPAVEPYAAYACVAVLSK